MPAIKSIELKCGQCATRFPFPIRVTTTEQLDTFAAMGNRAQCPKCQQMVHCNLENIVVRYADGSGGEMGGDFPDNKA